MAESATTDVYHPNAKWEWLEPLCLSGSVNLAFETSQGVSWPVLLDDIVRDQALIIDITAVPALARRLIDGEAFHLIGHVNGAMVRTSALAVLEPLEAGEGIALRCQYPEFLCTTHRRGTFRAAIRAEMGVTATLSAGSTQALIPAEIRNLSLGGCLLALRLADAVSLQAGQRFEALNLDFPSGQALTLDGFIRHVRTDDEWTSALIGCEFSALSIDHERLLWRCVREIERESARTGAQRDLTLQPSALFLSPTGKKPMPVALPTRIPADVAGNITAKRLLGVADYLNAQILALQNGSEIASSLLSRHTDTLLTLGVQSRESLLYALGYLAAEPVLVQHALNVAVRASDLARWQRYDADTLKAITACALVHDLGKALLPRGLLESERPLDAGQREQLSRHVDWVRERLMGCRWLASDIADAIIGEANERLDGSGYPAAKSDAQLGELGRMMAIVDVIDAMTRARPDRPALTLVDSYRQVLGQPDRFDSAWAQRYIKRFGTTPVGSLVRYASGAVAWVQRLDEGGRPDQVHMVLNANNRSRRLDQLLIGGDIDQLGRLEGMVVPEAFGLSRTAR